MAAVYLPGAVKEHVHPASFIATDHIAAVNASQITEQRVDNPVELEIFLRLAAKGRLGAGERAAIAVALNRRYALAVDDSRATRRALQEPALGENTLTILRTQDLVVELIRGQVISVEART